MTRLSVDAINIINTIKKTGSFSTAADVLHKTPSAISYQVLNIESRLKVKLFHRNGPIIRLTKEGEFLLQEGVWILNAVQDLENRVRNIPTLDNQIRIVVEKFLPLDIFVQDIRDYINTSGNIHISIQREAMTGAWDALKENRADFIIALGNVPENVKAKMQLLGKLSFALCVSPSHPFASKNKVITREQLLNDIHVEIADSSHELSFNREKELILQKQILVCDLESKLILIKRGIGYGFICPSHIKNELKKQELVIVPVEIPKDDQFIWLAWHPASKGGHFSWWKERLIKKIDASSFTENLSTA
ncbi:LysR family transcriptional regulator [Providencia manganoxydans]|uniref:LysR family transcriptional regulator n=1 Tax=Providencia manganoxydans TaxID=2923283 RepID=UPI0034E40438